MDNKTLATLLFAPLLISGIAFASNAKVTITAPADGAVIGSSDKVKLSYDAITGPQGGHLHLNVDGKRKDVLRQLKGTAEIDPLPPGKHQLCLAVNTKAHAPVGIEECVNVTSK